ncbi:cupredoxin domain-containing protein [Denitrobaculum tricleocarpae]|uniref:Copper-binding protein n=1 Tax=Denitrobaculum tricleocarpae TaxID=2591009 RepID=A0A545TKS9_9PROT|nr:plastocyanin/azurin family copper-binding protein [Denitrobaculum tricleocarpae]TQV77832.1 copper-binding protein [Denitrobaculum tricleocarpae]
MTLFTRLFAAAFLTVFAAVSASAEADTVSDICSEAEARYVELMGHPSAEAAGVTVVTMYKYNFCPARITVPVGTTVRWVNVDKRTSHSVLVKNSGEPESDRVFAGENIEFTFMLPGPQDYLCGPHWEVQNMIGRVTVVP